MRTPQPPETPEVIAQEEQPGTSATELTYRWTVEMPSWQRYDKRGEFPYVNSHWYDPFDRNRLKGDYPVFGQRWFFNFTGTSESNIDVRRCRCPAASRLKMEGMLPSLVEASKGLHRKPSSFLSICRTATRAFCPQIFVFALLRLSI